MTATKSKNVPQVVLAENGQPVGYTTNEKRAQNFINSYKEMGYDTSKWRFLSTVEYTTKL